MTDNEAKKSQEGVRRFLKDFRSHVERRSFDERRGEDRRSGAHEVGDERRASGDRRDSYDRRETLLDRRRGTPEQFILEHVVWIRDALRNRDVEVACPRCGGDLLLGASTTRGSRVVREVHCTVCRHSVVLPDVPEQLG